MCYILNVASSAAFQPNFAHFILNPGMITNFFLNILSTAICATFSADNDFRENFTPATLLKFVSTGPGHRQQFKRRKRDRNHFFFLFLVFCDII